MTDAQAQTLDNLRKWAYVDNTVEFCGIVQTVARDKEGRLPDLHTSILSNGNLTRSYYITR